MEGTALSQEVVNAPLLPSEESRVKNLLLKKFIFVLLLAQWPNPKFSKKEGFPHSPGLRVCVGSKRHTASSHPNPPLLATDTVLPHASPAIPLQDPRSQVRVIPHSLPLLRDAVLSRSLRCCLHRA